MLPTCAAEPRMVEADGPSLDAARAEVSALAMHLHALTLTNRSLLEQLAEAKRRAESVEGDLSMQQERLAANAGGRRAREGDDDDERRRPRGHVDDIYDFDDDNDDDTADGGRPCYRCHNESIPILSGSDGLPDEFDDADSPEEPHTFRGVNDDGDFAARTGAAPVNLRELKRVTAAFGALVAQGGAKDAAILEQLDRLALLPGFGTGGVGGVAAS